MKKLIVSLECFTNRILLKFNYYFFIKIIIFYFYVIMLKIIFLKNKKYNLNIFLEKAIITASYHNKKHSPEPKLHCTKAGLSNVTITS
jgi:hypothetical protein